MKEVAPAWPCKRGAAAWRLEGGARRHLRRRTRRQDPGGHSLRERAVRRWRPATTARDGARADPREQPAPSSPAVFHSPAAPPPRVEPDSTGPDLATSGYVALALGGASLTAGAVLQILAAVAQNDAEKQDRYAEFDELQSDMETYQNLAFVGFAVGGAAAAAGIVLLLLDGGGDGAEQVSLTLHPAGLGLGGNESYPGVFEPFGGFADDTPVENGKVHLPDAPGIGIELKAELMKVYHSLTD